MSTFEKVLQKRSYIPEGHVTLPLSSFATDYPSRPQAEIALGLRLVSDADIQTMRAEAAKFAIDMHDDHEGRVESFNDAIMRWMIVRGTCDPNDTRLNASLFEGSEENVRNALTSNAIRYLWDNIERFHLEKSPLVLEATDTDILGLVEYLKTPEVILGLMSPALSKRARKLLGFLLEEFREADPNYEEPDDEEELPLL